ncbi:hypothetical protein ACFVVU_09145 [Kitasatospora sp. NPDC057965]|uniref:hypothetical protein n=1 Tax=Kitasatospora sp. NPDC057965 TaxID=3346291 RepID=UPI0036D8AD98
MELRSESPPDTPMDFATALPRLEQAGEELVLLGRISALGRTYLAFLNASVTRCVACL